MTGLGYDGRLLERLGSLDVALTAGGHRVRFLSWGFIEPRPWRNYLHTHSFFEVCHAYAGHGTYRHGDDEHHVQSGDLIVARPGDVHEIVSSDDDPLGLQFWQFTLLPDSGDRELLDAFTAPAGPVLSATGDRIAPLLELLTGEAAGPAHPEIVEALCATLVLDTARAVTGVAAAAVEPAAQGRDELLVAAMERYLKDNHDRHVTIRNVAAQVHLSERHANRLFRRVSGTTIHAYLARYRLGMAAQRLTARQHSIKEVARLSGYPDVRAFTTAFRRHWGTTPAAYRRHGGTELVNRPKPT